MKRKLFICSTFALLLGLTACTQDGLPKDGAEGTPMTFTATGLNFPDARSRATVDGDWEGVNTVAVKIGYETKAYTVTSVSGDNASVTLTSGNPFYWSSTVPVTVSAWPCTDISSPDMPFPDDHFIERMPEVVVQEDQSGDGFAESDFIAAEPQEVSIGDPSLKFTHRTARVTVTLISEDGSSVNGATMNFLGLNTRNGNPASIISHNVAGTNVYEALLPPQTINQGVIFISVKLGGISYTYTLKDDDIELEAGNRYNYTLSVNATGLELEEVSGGEWTDSNESEDVTSREILVRYTADDVKKGDYIYQDGTTSDGGLRLIYADGTMVTTPEKPQPKNDDANPVVGIVFWTPSETTPQTGRNTPASLEYDLIMRAEHPECTHGLAVALKDATYDGSGDMFWQHSIELIADFQSGENFSHDSKGNFKSIASGSGEYDPMNYILGYQNTVVLRAYNTYCQNNDKSDYIVRPVAAIDDFDDTNPAPDNSTGWFLPSPKELHILYYKDVDNIYNNSGVETYNIVNSSLTAAGGDRLYGNWYWSSGELSYGYAWGVGLYNGSVYYRNKYNFSYYVRLAFAF